MNPYNDGDTEDEDEDVEDSSSPQSLSPTQSRRVGLVINSSVIKFALSRRARPLLTRASQRQREEVEDFKSFPLGPENK